jgi:hypothetical protein
MEAVHNIFTCTIIPFAKRLTKQRIEFIANNQKNTKRKQDTDLNTYQILFKLTV